jgi:hypothetical protein
MPILENKNTHTVSIEKLPFSVKLLYLQFFNKAEEALSSNDPSDNTVLEHCGSFFEKRMMQEGSLSLFYKL